MNHPPNEDSILLQRFLDGELSAAEAKSVQQRLESEAGLADAYAQLKSLRVCFAAGRDQVMATPPDLVEGVMANVRKQPSREDLIQLEAGGSAGVAAELAQSQGLETPRNFELVQAVRFAQRLSIAALLLLGLGLLLWSGLFGGGRPASLEAAPDLLEQQMADLDARIRAEEAAAEAGGPR